jgi:AbrB family looped-hinge helix DNA binding protein
MREKGASPIIDSFRNELSRERPAWTGAGAGAAGSARTPKTRRKATLRLMWQAIASIGTRYYDLRIDGGCMSTVTISPKYQVVIPKAIREKLRLRPGQKVQALVYGDRIELIPVRPMKEMRGFLEGLDTLIERDSDRP